jgi:hypothetical protein
LKGSEIAATETVYEARTALNSGRKNMIINGAMSINQRNGTSSYVIPNATGGSYGGPDRWAINEATGGAINVNMDGDPSSANADKYSVQEFSKAMQLACSNGDSSVTGNENAHFFQNIEGYNVSHLKWGTELASDVTLSFWVKCNVPGIYCVGLENDATNRACIKEYTINPEYRWQKVVLTFPGCTDGTWEKTTAVGIRVRFCLSSGSSYTQGVEGKWVNTDELATSNQVNWMQDSNSRYFITGVQLEKGRIATEFEHRFYADELALCQRYFWSLTSPFNGNWNILSWGHGGSSNRVFSSIACPVAMRNYPQIYNKFINVQDGGTVSDVTDRLYPNTLNELGGSANIVSYGGYPQGTHLSLSITAVSTANGNGYRVNIKNVSNNAGYIYFESEL